MSVLERGTGLWVGEHNPHAIPPWLVFAAFFAITGPPLLLTALYSRRVDKRPSRHRTATVLVLGDIGRSPRMMYHAESLARAGWDTYLVGYGDTAPIPALLETPLVHLLYLHNPPKPLLALPWIFRAPIRIVYQIVSVLYLCVFVIPCNTQIMIVQNPPSIPTLALAQFICKSTHARLIIDWHNTGYSILGLRLGAKHRLVGYAERFERYFGRSAFCHLFVTQALEEYLTKEWNLRGHTAVLHDRPPSSFGRTELITQLNLFRRLAPTISPPLPAHLSSKDIRKTAFTELKADGSPGLREDRPAFIISSTSWTADEDFSLLFTALDKYQAAKTAGADVPQVFMIITGKGALRDEFEAQVAKREQKGAWPDVTVRCMFVPARDYPLLLGCTDLGISMHQSSSGRDLPMKVVDMFGCGLPVLARGFSCIAELVKDGLNGRVFNTADELCQELIETLTGFPHARELERLQDFFKPNSRASTPSRRRFTVGGREHEWSTWDENWDAVMKRGVLDFKRF